MKNTLIVIIVVLVVVFGGYFLFNQNTDSLEDTTILETSSTVGDEIIENNREVVEDDSSEEVDSPVGDESAVTAPEPVVQNEVKEFNLTGRNFRFSQDEIRVKKGDTVRISFTSESGFHDWVVDEFDAATARVQTGDSASVEFVADASGTFEFYCSVGTHRQQGMFGKLIVE